MPEPLIYVDRSEVREGALEDLKLALDDLVQLIDANEPAIVLYRVYFSDDARQLTVLQVHRDPASLAFHLDVAGPAFSTFAPYIRMLGIDVYGTPSSDVLDRLRQKSQLLGSGTVTVHQLHRGFARLPTSE